MTKREFLNSFEWRGENVQRDLDELLKAERERCIQIVREQEPVMGYGGSLSGEYSYPDATATLEELREKLERLNDE